MSHTLHHLCWLVRRFRLPVTISAVSWTLLLVAVWTVGITEWDKLFSVAHGALMIPPLLLVIAVVWQDEAGGTESFWRTRPPRWRAVWLSQALFILLFLAGPAILCWAVNGLLMHHTAVQWIYGALDLLFIICPMLALAGAASFSRTLSTLAIVLAGAALAITGGVLSMVSVAGAFSGPVFQSGIYRSFMVGVWGIPSVVLVVGWMTAMKRQVSLVLVVATWLWLLSLPSLVWVIVRPRAFWTVLEVTAGIPGAPLQPGEQAAGVFTLRGLPEGTEALVENDYLQLDNRSNPDDPSGVRLLWLDLQSNRKSSDPSQRPGFLTPRAGNTIRAALPPATRWFADAMDTGRPFIWEVKDWMGRGPVERRLLGEAIGVLGSTVPLVTVPLEEGATAAENGSRVRIHRISHGQENLEVEVHLWLAAGLDTQMPPGGILGEITSLIRDPLPVIYFPSVPMAALLMNRQVDGEFRSWQCQTRRHRLKFSMPNDELRQGVRWMPETLRGAQLLYFSQVQHGRFRVRFSEEPMKIVVP